MRRGSGEEVGAGGLLFFELAGVSGDEREFLSLSSPDAEAASAAEFGS